MKILFIILVCIPCIGNAQKDIPGGSSIPTTAGLIMDARDVNGKQIPTSSKLDIEGSPMLVNDFVNGAVWFKGKENPYNLLLNLSLVDNQLYFKKENRIFKFIDAVDYFSITVKDNDSTQLIYFKSGYPSIGNNNEQMFYQILAEGKKVELLKYRFKIVQEKANYGGSHEREYMEKERLFIFDVSNKTLTMINASIKTIKKALPNYSALIDQFTSVNKLKNQEDLKNLFALINN